MHIHKGCGGARKNIPSFVLMIAILTMMSGTANAQKIDEKPVILTDLAQCQTVSEAEERLRCYDKTVAALIQAEADDELVVVDKEQVEEARRGVFGLRIPRIKLFGSDNGLTEIQTTISSARRGPRGKWSLVLANGSRWQQIGNKRLARYPREGFKIRIRAASMNSFFANIEGQTAIKVKRVN